MKRYADTFFRYLPIALLPIFVLPFGALLLTKTPTTVYGSANIWVDQGSLQDLSYVNTGMSPADNLSTYLNQLLLIRSFDVAVAKRSPSYWRTLVNKGPYPQDQAAADLSAHAQAITGGPNLVGITYTATDPTAADPMIAIQVVRGILNEAAHEIMQVDQQAASKSIGYYARQLKLAQARYSAAARSLGSYVAAQNIPESELAARQLSDPKLAQLYQAVQSAQTDIGNIQGQLSKAQTQQTTQIAFQIKDPPAAKVVTSSMKKRITGLVIPLVLGLLLGGGFIVTKTALDRSVRFADEVPDLLGLPVLTVVPFNPAMAGQTTRRRRRSVRAAAGREG